MVLFGRENMIRLRPSNSSNLTGGGGSMGTRRMTEDSTCGGGRKSFRETLMMLSTFAYSWVVESECECKSRNQGFGFRLTWTLADNRDHRAVPGRATRRSANSRWNMRIATRKSGLWDKRRNTSGEEIWYGVLEMHTSK